MQLERLVIDSGERTLTTEFHHRLTVIGGLDPRSRTALAGELLDALSGARPGVHLELTLDGRSLTVFRPTSGPHRVVDTDAVADVTHLHRGPNGDIDLFASLGVDRSLARNTIRFTRDDLVLRGESDAWTSRLASLDQDELWAASQWLTEADAALAAVADEAGTSSSDAAVVELVEEHHHALVEATERYERIRLIALTIATVGAIAGIAATQRAGTLFGVPFVLAALAGVLLAISYRRQVDRAARAERDVLASAGADGYASFHSERVRSLLDNDESRRRFMMAVSDHHDAERTWTRIAGPVPHRFAVEHERQIRSAAERSLDFDPTHTIDLSGIGGGTETELARAVLGRVEAVRALTGTRDCLPLIVDDPFVGLSSADKALLLDLLVALPESPQVVVLTADEEVASWARLEAAAGRVAIARPEITRTPSLTR